MKSILSTIVLSFVLLLRLCGQSDQHMDFEAYDPPSSLVVPEHEYTHAKFRFIDVHSHHWQMATQDLDKLIREMDALNMGIIVNLSGGNGEAFKAKMDNVKKYGYENRIVIFANIDFNGVGSANWTENAVKQLETDYKNGAKGLKIFKNLGMDVKDNKGKRVPVDDPRLDAIWEKCGELGIPVLIHSADPKQFWEPLDANNERWLEIETHPGRNRADDKDLPSWATIIHEQHQMFKKHPKTKFIAAHMSWHANDLDKLGHIMDTIPNMNVEIGAIIAELGRQPRQALKFFTKYQDRILFGKDSYVPEEYHTYFHVLESADEYFPYYKQYHAFWRMYGLELPDEILKKLYYKNALRVIPGLDASKFPK